MMEEPNRILCWFSCGAASAVATKLAIADNAGKLPLVIAYTEVIEEHQDNQRFLADCEKWFGQDIAIIRNEKYNASIFEVFKRERFLVSPYGAPCTKHLKKWVRQRFEQPGDIQVFGYTAEEQNRVDRFIDANNDVRLLTPLINRGMTKNDCLGLLQKVGIELPAMYLLGYHNNNCIGCVKGGIGYWKKIKADFPEQFERMAQMEEHLGRTILKSTINGIQQRITLREIDDHYGRYNTEPDIDCGIFCHMAEDEIKTLEGVK